MIDDGEAAPASGAESPVCSRDPATGEEWCRFESSTPDDVAAAVDAARSAQPAWARRPVEERVSILARMHERLFARREEVAHTISRENGKPLAEALATEVATTLDLLRFYTRQAPRILATRRTAPASIALWRKRIVVTQAPFGVVAVISPWNYPFLLPAGIVIPALVAGNGVVLKPSELTPSSGALLRAIAVDAGVPPELLHVVHGGGGTGSALVRSAVDKVFFTGSVAAGRRVATSCAERLVPCVLELGGSDPAIVLADADVEHAASGILWGRFSNSGQTCVAPKRVLVEEGVHDRLVAALERRLRALAVGGGRAGESDMGSLIRPAQRPPLAALREDALGRGAREVRGGGPAGESSGAGWFAPTLLLDVPRDARVLREETFGPLLPVVRVRDAEEAIAIANDSDFGLSASVWTRDRARGRAVADRLEAGTVVINDVALVAGMAEVPHGGVKHSGYGRAHGVAGLEECVRTRTVVDDLFPRWRQPWWFGYAPSSFRRMDGYVRLAHGTTLRSRLSGVLETWRLVFCPERRL